MVHQSKNTPFVIIRVTLWISIFYEEKAKVFCITLQHLKEFYHFIAKLKNKSHSPQWEVGQHFQISKQIYTKTELVGGFDTCESF